MAQPQHPFSGRRRQVGWGGDRDRDGALGTGPPGSGEWKAGEVIAEWMFAEVNGVGPPASFQQEDPRR